MEAQLSRIETQLRMPRPAPPDVGRLRAALEQRTVESKRDLRAETKIARLGLRRWIGPLTLHDESERPEWCRWEAQPTPDRLADWLVRLVASPRGSDAAWNAELRGDTRAA